MEKVKKNIYIFLYFFVFFILSKKYIYIFFVKYIYISVRETLHIKSNLDFFNLFHMAGYMTNLILANLQSLVEREILEIDLQFLHLHNSRMILIHNTSNSNAAFTPKLKLF